MNAIVPDERAAALRRAIFLEQLSIVWMLAEGIIAVASGLAARSLTLVAFGWDSLIELVTAMGIPVRALLREKGTPYAELGLADPKWSDDELIDFMLAHPILINRPIVVTAKGVRLCRPSELVLDILDNPVTSFVKEDGEAVKGKR